MEIITNYWLIILLFFCIAILYSSVGFGGGSSYLAVLALSALSFTEFRIIALVCNIMVVSGNVFNYQKHKNINWQKVLPLVLCSIPLAFIGGSIKLEQSIFFILLGFTLLSASLFMWLSKDYVKKLSEKKDKRTYKNIAYGGIIGFISGLVGIGGGIFLAPLLHITKWDTPRKIAATASVFILLNSISGIFGQLTNPNLQINWSLTLVLAFTVLLGGQIGNRLSNKILTPIQLKKGTALLIFLVSIRLLYKYLLS